MTRSSALSSPSANNDDGGYYAMKGFSFQLNKTLAQLLDTDQMVGIEQIQDFADPLTFTQVKYKEASRYYPSSIKRPVCQIFQDSLSDSRKPILFCFFKDEPEREVKLTRDQLDHILGDCVVGTTIYSFSDKQRNEFLETFRIVFSPSFLVQLQGVFDRIMTLLSCDPETAKVFYSVMTVYLQEKVIQNPEAREARQCSRDELLKHARECERSLYLQKHIRVVGKERFFRSIRSKYFTENNLDFHERFFVIDLIGQPNASEIAGLVLRISKRFYRPYRKLVKSPSPYFVLRNADPLVLRDVKLILTQDDRKIRDGFCFEGSGFVLANLIEECTISNQIEAKFVNDVSYLPHVLAAIKRHKKIYHLFTGSKLRIVGSYEEYSIQIEHTGDIDLIFPQGGSK